MTEKIDFTEMYVTHDALRRDLDRMEAATAAGRARAPKVREGWETFKAQLLVHHSVEDAALWPPLTELVQYRPDALTLLKDMEAEHGRLDPLLAAFDDALDSDAPDLHVRVKELADVLGQHLEHEEAEALPLIQEVMTPGDWGVFRRAMARRQGVRGAAVWVPWITDGMPGDERRRVLRRFPAPLRVVHRLLWEPRYRARNLWAY